MHDNHATMNLIQLGFSMNSQKFNVTRLEIDGLANQNSIPDLIGHSLLPQQIRGYRHA